jgi:hypothetical protein
MKEARAGIFANLVVITNINPLSTGLEILDLDVGG